MYEARLKALREAMKEKHYDMYMLTTDDENFSGAMSPDKYWRPIEWMTGFASSFGFMLITQDIVTFWTDHRYYEQAKKMVKLPGTQLFDVTQHAPDFYLNWITEEMGKIPGDRLVFGADGRTFTNARAAEIRTALQKVAGKEVTWNGQTDLINEVWTDRPDPDYTELFDLDLKYTGESRPQKLERLRGKLAELGCTAYVSCTMDTVAWMTNLRCRGEINSMFPGYLLVTREDAKFFCKKTVLSPELEAQLNADGLSCYDLTEVRDEIAGISADEVLFFDRLNDAVMQAIPAGIRTVGGRDPVSRMKCCKNAAEEEAFRQANRVDSAIIVKIIKNLKETVATAHYHELDFTEQFDTLRKQSDIYMSSGCATVLAAYMANAASPHYFPGPGRNCEVKPEGVLLFDTGANFLGATTDVSRTVYLGPCEYDEELIRDYTVSLKSLIALARQKFKKGATAAYLDSVARCVLWNECSNYSYGTGHGIGAGLNCHEGPMIIAEPSYNKEWATSSYPLQPGMVMSDEPGVYKDGKYGIRLENDQIVKKVCENEYGEFYQFDSLSYCPFDPALIDARLLSDEELQWLNDYHARTYEWLCPLLTEDEQAWLKEQCKEIRK